MAYRNYSTAASRIVDPNGFGDFKTITSALTAASSGQTIFIRPGTYTENLTLKAGVNLSAFPCDAGQDNVTSNVVIVGKCSATFAGSCSLSGLQLRTNSDYCLSLTGTNATNVNLFSCFIDASNHTAIQNTCSVAQKLILDQCNGDIGTTGIAYFDLTGAGQIIFNNGYYQNNGSSTTASTNSSSTGGGISFFGVQYFNNAFTSTNGGQLSAATSNFLLPLITSGTTDSITLCTITGNSSSAISVSTGGILILTNSVINSSNTNAITGLGTIKYGGVTFSGSSSTINTSTKTPIALPVLQGGTGLTSTTINQILYSSSANTIAGLATANSGILVTNSSGVPSINATVTSWTPVLQFGGASTGITYNAQAGGYYQIGQLFCFDCYVDISNKGSSTGAATISGLPAISPARTSIFVISANSLTYVGQVNARMPNGTSSISLDSWATTGARTQLSDTAFSNSTFLQISGQVLLS